MAFTNGKLSDIVVVSAGSTSDIVTVASNKKVYVKSILCHAPGVGAAASATAQVYIIPNGGSVGANTKIFDVDVNAGETVLLEPAYPIVIEATGDKISVGAGTSTVNFFITGDKEA
tara:strand:+ start:173 stop:520 length:348 start_codon:yes stop_codon:yes gene_type:complete